MNVRLAKALKIFLIVIGVLIPLVVGGYQLGWLGSYWASSPTSPNTSGEIEIDTTQLADSSLGAKSAQVDQNKTSSSPLLNHPLILSEAIEPEIALALINFDSSVEIIDFFVPDTTVISLSLSDDRSALINDNPHLVEEQLFKLKLILEYFDFDNLDEPIEEIDVRYRLPVLRVKPLAFEKKDNDFFN